MNIYNYFYLVDKIKFYKNKFKFIDKNKYGGILIFI